MNDDCKIWEDLKAGKEYALPEVYQQHIDFLFNYGKKFSKDENIVLDAIHDIFYELIRNHTSLGSTDNIRLYLIKSLRRKLFRILEKSRRFDNFGYDLEQFIPEITFSVEEHIIREEEKVQKLEYIRNAMKQLTQQQREVLYYKFTCGFDYSEICDILSISYDSARKIVSRSIQLLRKNIPSNIYILFVSSITK